MTELEIYLSLAIIALLIYSMRLIQKFRVLLKASNKMQSLCENQKEILIKQQELNKNLCNQLIEIITQHNEILKFKKIEL